MVYKYECCYKDFGCNVTRSKKKGIEKHELECQFRKYKKYVDAIHENQILKTKIVQLETRRGRPPVEIQQVDIDKFQEQFINNISMQNALHKLNNRPCYGIKALIVIFIYCSPRFYKLKSLSEIDICGNVGFLRTAGRVERHPLIDVSESIFESMRDFISISHKQFGYKDLTKFKMRESVSADRVFLFNLMRQAALSGPDKPIVWRRITVPIPSPIHIPTNQIPTNQIPTNQIPTNKLKTITI